MRRFQQALIVRIIGLFIVIAAVIAALSGAVRATRQSVYAQATEPTTVIDAVFRDLSTRLGQSLTRQNVQNYSWTQVQFPDNALGCPAPGVSYTAAIVPGYQVSITTRTTNTSYDYRTRRDGSQIVLCVSGIPATLAAVVTGTLAPSDVPTLTPPAISPTALVALPISTIIPVSANLAAPGTATAYTNPIAFIGSDGNVYLTAASGGTITPITNDANGPTTTIYPFYTRLKVYENLHWSPDGTRLLFDDGLGQTLYVAETGKAPQPIVQNFDSQLPATWARDGGSILYTLQTDSTTLYAIRLGGAPAVAIGQLAFQTSCGGDNTSLLAQIYTDETGLNGNTLLLAQTPVGLIYSTDCGGVGLALLGTNTQPGWSNPSLRRAVLSPDGTKLVALQTSPTDPDMLELVEVDVATGNVIPIVDQPNIDQVGWVGDGSSILYSTRVPSGQLAIPTLAAGGSQVFAPWPPFPADTVTDSVALWKVPATGGAPQAVFQTNGYAIGNMVSTADNQSAVISVIGDLKPVFDALTTNQPIEMVEAAFPAPKLVIVPLNAPTVLSIAQGGSPAAGRGTFNALAVAPIVANVPVNASGTPLPTPFTADTPVSVPLTVSPALPTAALAPPALVIGGKATVTATGAVLNVRDTPSATGKILRQLVTSQVVTVIGGPISADGFRWWQIQLKSGVIGWAVDQFTDNTGTTNTLSPQ